VHDAGKAFVHMSDGGSEAHLPDVILLDLNLPVMDGFAFLVEMAKEERLKYIPVFVLSASSARVDREKARKLGARGYLTKPLDLDQFENENSRAFQGSRAGMSKS
jgi:CheY-like chemotaxis protein